MKFLAIFSVLFLVIISALIFHSGFLKITSIDVSLNKIGCTDADQIKKTSNLIGQNIILLDSSRISYEIKNKFVCVKDVNVRRKFPGKVDLNVAGRNPKAMLLMSRETVATESSLDRIATPSARQSGDVNGFVVDEEGVVFAKGDATSYTDIPRIYDLNGNISLGQKIKMISDALEVLDKITSFNLSFSESEILNGLFLIYPRGTGPRIIFNLEDNLDTKLASLQLILGQAKMDGKDLEFIDLRFDKPIVKFAPKIKNG